MELIGWIGTLLLGCCGIPSALRAIKRGEAESYSLWFIAMYLTGAILATIYTISLANLPITIMNIMGFLCISIVTKYRLFPRK